uniref:KIB1-4 beta-propeller domain-containing protein n=1 Tax=Aegilops tauschii TaxID=37682 RepID=N1QQY9_AEGTA
MADVPSRRRRGTLDDPLHPSPTAKSYPSWLHGSLPSSCPEQRRDWANLSDGPMGIIAERVLAYDIADFLRMDHSPPPALSKGGIGRISLTGLWGLSPSVSSPTTSPTSSASVPRFLNPSTGECIHVDIPELREHEVLALTPEGLLVLLHNQYHVRLLNPLTSQLMQLPPITMLLPSEDHHRLSDRYNFGTNFAAWGSGIADDDSTVVLCFYRLRMLGVAKPGDDRWTLLKFPDPLRTVPLMFSGRFYCVNLNGVMVLRMSPPRLEVAAKLHIQVSREGYSAHLVDNGGELMLVHRRRWHRWSYDVYRVDLATGDLVAVNSLGRERALFMGMYCSLSVPIEIFPSGSMSGDTIYLSFDAGERDDFEAYHLTDRSITPHDGYNLRESVMLPHTIVDCLALCITVGYEEHTIGYGEDLDDF